MPELPEVENYRQILLPLTSSASQISLECPSPVPPKSFPSNDVINAINNGGYIASNVLRKGKLLCIILEKRTQAKTTGTRCKRSRPKRTATSRAKSVAVKGDDDGITGNETKIYLSLHMGMTGRIASPNHVPSLESLSESDIYPPPHTHLMIRTQDGEEACFSDPRRFGTVMVHKHSSGDESKKNKDHADELAMIPTFQELAPDALRAAQEYCSQNEQKGSNGNEKQQTIAQRLTNHRKGIKALLLDQRAICSGVGNWVADEVLYRSRIHPDQNFLNEIESHELVKEMLYVLSTAVVCLNDGGNFPEDWLFHRRWRSGGGTGVEKDYYGKKISFLQSGGRSSAVVPAIQKKKSRQTDGSKATSASRKRKEIKAPEAEQKKKTKKTNKK